MQEDLKNALLLKDEAKKGYIAGVWGGIGFLACWLLVK